MLLIQCMCTSAKLMGIVIFVFFTTYLWAFHRLETIDFRNVGCNVTAPDKLMHCYSSISN